MVFYLDIDTVEEKDPIRVKIFALKCPNFTMVEATCLITHILFIYLLLYLINNRMLQILQMQDPGLMDILRSQ